MRSGELRLHLDVADLARAIPRLQVVDLGDVRVEGVVVDEHRVALDRAGDVGAHPLRDPVYICRTFFFTVSASSDRSMVFAVALAHLAVVEARAAAASAVSSACGSTNTSP